MARLIFINRFYWPDPPATGQLLADLAEALARAGHQVAVIASCPPGMAPKSERNGVTIFRVRSTRWRRAGLPGQAVDFLSFYLGALSRLGREADAASIVVPMTDPPLLGVGASRVVRRRRAGLIHWVQDVYPEIAVEVFGQRWLAGLRPWRDAAWCRADRCVTLSPDMDRRLARAGVPASRRIVLPNWPPAGLAPVVASGLRSAWRLVDKFVIAYSGNLGRVHELRPILSAAEALRGDPTVAFVFVGDGPQRRELAAATVRRRLANVQFHPAQPRVGLAESLGVADVHLVTLRAGCEELVFPSKLYGIAAVGKPVLFIGPTRSEIARQVRAAGMGLVADPDDLAGILAAVAVLRSEPGARTAMGRAALAFAEAHGLAHAAAAWDRLVREVEACRERGASPMTEPQA